MKNKLPYKNMNYKVKNKHKGFLALGAASYLFLLITVEIILFISITVIGRGKENAINRVHLKSAFEKAYLIEREKDLPIGDFYKINEHNYVTLEEENNVRRILLIEGGNILEWKEVIKDSL